MEVVITAVVIMKRVIMEVVIIIMKVAMVIMKITVYNAY